MVGNEANDDRRLNQPSLYISENYTYMKNVLIIVFATIQCFMDKQTPRETLSGLCFHAI